MMGVGFAIYLTPCGKDELCNCTGDTPHVRAFNYDLLDGRLLVYFGTKTDINSVSSITANGKNIERVNNF